MKRLIDFKNLIKSEYSWLPIMYVIFAACILSLTIFHTFKVEESQLLMLIVLVTVFYNTAILNICVRALKRIEGRSKD